MRKILIIFSLIISFLFSEESLIIDDFEEESRNRYAERSRKCELLLSEEFFVNGKKGGKFIVSNEDIKPSHPPYFSIEPTLTDWKDFNTISFYILFVSDKIFMPPSNMAPFSLILLSTDFDEIWIVGNKLQSFSFYIPVGKIVRVSIPLDKVRFKEKVGKILFCAKGYKGIYYIDKVEISKRKEKDVDVNEVTLEGINIPLQFSVSIHQDGGFWDIDRTFYYNSKKPVIINLCANKPIEKEEKIFKIYYGENQEILSKKIVFEKPETRIFWNINKEGNFKLNFDGKEESFKMRDIKKIENENIKIMKNRKKKKDPFARGIISLYAGMIYDKDGNPDIEKMVEIIKDLRANCYTYLIAYRSEKELEFLPKFLEKAEKEGIEVWVYTVPPSEAPIGRDKPINERKYLPFDMDYLKWAEAIAKISLQYPNLTLWMIDDFDGNLNFYTIEYTKKIYEKTKEINPKLLFGVCVYYNSIKDFVNKGYLPFFDAVLWGYQHSYSLWPECGISAKSLPVEINTYYKLCPGKILIPCIYFTPHSSWPKGRPTKEYLEEAIKIAFEQTGICWVYTTPKPGDFRYDIVKNFTTSLKLSSLKNK